MGPELVAKRIASPIRFDEIDSITQITAMNQTLFPGFFHTGIPDPLTGSLLHEAKPGIQNPQIQTALKQLRNSKNILRLFRLLAIIMILERRKSRIGIPRWKSRRKIPAFQPGSQRTVLK